MNQSSTEALRIIEWYRADSWPRMRRVLLAGPSILTLGSIVVAGSFITHQSTTGRIDSAIVGVALVAGGALLTTLGMHRILREDVCLTLRTDGVVVQSSGGEAWVGWDELVHVRWDGPRVGLVLERLGGEPIAIRRAFKGIDGPTLATRIDAIKRRVAMNLIH